MKFFRTPFSVKHLWWLLLMENILLKWLCKRLYRYWTTTTTATTTKTVLFMNLTAITVNKYTLMHPNVHWNENPLSIWNLPNVTSKKMKLLNTVGKNRILDYNKKKNIDRESRLCLRTIKETTHILRNSNLFNIIFCTIPDMWLPHLL